MSSAKVKNNGSFGSKRSRNDGDWTCPKCGNMNFGFRTVCNRGKCGAPRPPATPSAPITSPYNHPPPFYFGGVGAPPPMPLGGPSRYGPPIPVPGMHYDYSPGNVHGPYGLLTTFPPGGMGYGSGPAISGYGFGFQGPPWAGGGMPDGTASRKRRGGPDGLSEGDWVCPKCDNVNFAFRTTCNMKKCGAARPSSGPSRSDSGAPEGSWTCSKCENLNYPFRTVCNRKGCGNEKPASDE
ncbi:ranBP2-type zinc finger protein At1g67325 isoform X2 [Vitis vinifera]|uniref:ranBP2-type zinc finger protein At1g67325 isoform X2 n=1 Tax=Vitis vinifera TaxID=29760 RepID=UPI002882E4F5|nr:ranBP2-type zinc finger protein At1g67325 isoform X2 [Vitis vinifera]